MYIFYIKCYFILTMSQKNKIMELKKTVLVLSILPFFLAACGGGGSDGDSSKSTQNQFKQGDRIYSINYSTTGSNDSFKAKFIDFKNGQFTFSDSNTILDETILTKNKLYVPSDLADRTITVHSPTLWTYNHIGNVKRDYVIETVNLSGKNIFDTVLPGYREVLADDLNSKAKLFLIKGGLKSFSNGSVCYKIKSTKNHVPYVNFNTDDNSIIAENFDEFYDGNKLYLDHLNKSESGVKFSLIKDQWLGINFTSIFDDGFKTSLDDSTAIEYQQVLYTAVYNQSFEKSAKAEYEVLEKQLPTISDSDLRKSIQLRQAEIKTGCLHFNEAAVKDVSNIIDLK